MDTGHYFGYYDLTDPGFINATAISIMQRLREAKLNSVKSSQFTIQTTAKIRHEDKLAKIISNIDHVLILERLFNSNIYRNELVEIRRLWREHLELTNDEELRDLLHGFRVIADGRSLDELRSGLEMKVRSYGIFKQNENKSLFLYDHLPYYWLSRSLNKFNRDEFLARCKEVGLLAMSAKPTGSQYSIDSKFYVSYPWDDKTPEGQEVKNLVDFFCAEAKNYGLPIWQISDIVKPGDRISKYATQIATGEQIFLFLNDQYLGSKYCMFEISEIWRTSDSSADKFLIRVKSYPVGPIDYTSLDKRLAWANYWKGEYNKINELISTNGIELFGDDDIREFKWIKDFYPQVSNILSALADQAPPGDIQEFIRFCLGDAYSQSKINTISGQSSSSKIKEPDHPILISVPGGAFEMGSHSNESHTSVYDGREEPRHRVEINYKFGMCPYPVSVGEFREFMECTNHNMGDEAYISYVDNDESSYEDDWRAVRGKGWHDPGFFQESNHPVTCVNWDDAQAYLIWLNERLGLSGRRDAYRLPSESEWEYSCRAGSETRFCFGDNISTQQANYYDDTTGILRGGTTKAGQFPANAFGLHDMHGNIWELCADSWSNNYLDVPIDGSPYIRGAKAERVVRGGSWINAAYYIRSATRDWIYEFDRHNCFGFRLARTILAK